MFFRDSIFCSTLIANCFPLPMFILCMVSSHPIPFHFEISHTNDVVSFYRHFSRCHTHKRVLKTTKASLYVEHIQERTNIMGGRARLRKRENSTKIKQNGHTPENAHFISYQTSYRHVFYSILSSKIKTIENDEKFNTIRL